MAIPRRATAVLGSSLLLASVLSSSPLGVLTAEAAPAPWQLSFTQGPAISRSAPLGALAPRRSAPAPTATRVSMPTGVNANGRAVAQAVRTFFPQITVMLGYRADSDSDHVGGRAVDIMIPDHRNNQLLGRRIAEFMRANAARLNITYVIWDQHIWSVQRDKEGWRPMANRGSDNANHRNHVHVSVK